MSIEFHCDHCSKLIRAPREAAGRRGKCPYCQQSVYIPTPTDEIDEIPLAPVDLQDAREQERLDEERRRTDRELLSDRRPPSDKSVPVASAESAMPSMIPGAEDDVQDRVVDYLLLMRNTQLVEAEEVLADLRRNKAAAIRVIDRLAADAIPPEALAGVPPRLYLGFLKNLRGELR